MWWCRSGLDGGDTLAVRDHGGTVVGVLRGVDGGCGDGLVGRAGMVGVIVTGHGDLGGRGGSRQLGESTGPLAVESLREDDDPGDLAIVQGVIGLARSFGYRVIAEGVETVEQGQMLLQLGCTQAQGYCIARPMPLEDFIGWTPGWQPPAGWQRNRPV